MGGFSGKLGPVVGYNWRGRWCMRALVEGRNPRTERQQAHRDLFRQQVQLASRFNWVLRQTMQAPSLELGMTPCNLFVHCNQAAFGEEAGRLTVEWERLVLAAGPVAPVAFTDIEVSEPTVLTLSFERNPTRGRANQYDSVSVFVYCDELGQGFWSAPVHRRAGRLAVALPDAFAGCEVQLWGLVQDRNGRWADSVYIGHGPVDPSAVTADAADPAATAGEGASTEAERNDNQQEKKDGETVLSLRPQGGRWGSNPRPPDPQSGALTS